MGLSRSTMEHPLLRNDERGLDLPFEKSYIQSCDSSWIGRAFELIEEEQACVSHPIFSVALC